MTEPEHPPEIPLPKPSDELTQEEALVNLAFMEMKIRGELRTLPEDDPERASRLKLLTLVGVLRSNIEASMPGTVFH